MSELVKVVDAEIVETSPPKGAVVKAALPLGGPALADLAEMKVLSAQASCRELIFELAMQVSLDANNARFASARTDSNVVKWLDKARAVDLSLEETLKVMKWGHYKWV